MHPILASGGRVIVYFVFWVLVGILIAAVLVNQGQLSRASSLLVGIPLAIMYGFVCLSAVYVARSMPLGRTSAFRVAATAATAAVVAGTGWLLIARSWTQLLHLTGIAPGQGPAISAVQTPFVGFGVLLYLLALSVGYLLAAFEQSRDVERRSYEAQVFARDAELRSLRTQIDPHFLFNSLHSISALTTIDPPAARRMCLLLADFFRDSVAVGARDQITLAQEFRLIERFLDVEQVRFGDRLQVVLDDGGAGTALVPPLILQPIVENAVTHGVAHTLEGGTVRVTALRTPSTLRLVVENPCDPDRPRRTGTGVGLVNVRSRLRALHGADAWVTTEEQHGVWRTEIVLPLVERQ